MRAALTFICIMLSAGIAVCQQPANVTAESMSKPSWTVRYLAGSLTLDTDAWLRITFAQQSAILGKSDLFITVRADQIVSIDFSAKVERDSDRIQGPRSGCSYARSMMPDKSKSRPEDMIATKVTPGRASRMAEKFIRHHPVHIIWIEEGKQQQVSVSINDCEYESLIANLRWLLGARWGEVARDISR
jgi:hypothetical protein